MRKHPKSLIALSLFVSLLASCAPKQAVDASAIAGPLKAVTVRHDAYVNVDTTLSAPEKATALRSSEILTEIVDQAMTPSTP